MGTISILLGIITFLGSTGGGILLSSYLIGEKAQDKIMGSLIQNMSDTTAMIIIIGSCAFIGLLICMNLVMAGLNYNKLRRVQKAIKRKI